MLFNTFILILRVKIPFVFSIIVISSASHSRCYLLIIYSIKLSFISHRLAVHLYSQGLTTTNKKLQFLKDSKFLDHITKKSSNYLK